MHAGGMPRSEGEALGAAWRAKSVWKGLRGVAVATGVKSARKQARLTASEEEEDGEHCKRVTRGER